MRTDTIRLLVRNVFHLGVGQVASTIIGLLWTAALGRWLEPSQFGILYAVFAITGFAGVFIDWGQSTYLVRELARGREDEPQLIGSALFFRLATIALSTVAAVGAAIALGYSEQVIGLTFLSLMVAIPTQLFAPFGSSFRSRDRMDIDAIANNVGKAFALLAIVTVLNLGGGLTEVIWAQGVGGVVTLLIGLIAARRLNVIVRPPEIGALRELYWRGAPIAAFSLLIATQPFVEILLLSALAGAAVVGWYGASRTLLSVVFAPAVIALAATFPELSRASRSVADLRQMIDATSRIMFIAAAICSSALYVFSDHVVAIIYGHGRFEQTAQILHMNAFFVPLLFFVLVLASAMTAVGRNRELVLISIVRIVFCLLFGWLLIEYWQQRFGNGAIVVVIIAGLAEIPAAIACLKILPKGAVGSTTTINLLRAYAAAFCTAAPLSMLQPLGLLYLVPLYILLFAAAAMATRLVLPSDLRLVVETIRNKMQVASTTKPGLEG